MAIVTRYSFDVWPANPPPAHKFWRAVLWMAHTDGATSVRFHPWKEEGSLAYILDGVRVAMVPPLLGSAGELVEAAQALFTRPIRGRFGRPDSSPACGVVEFDVSGVLSVWDVVVWTTGERSGVELFRVTPTAELPPTTE